MKQRFLMPPIPESERTPLVIALLGVIEGLAERVQKQEEEIALLAAMRERQARSWTAKKAARFLAITR